MKGNQAGKKLEYALLVSTEESADTRAQLWSFHSIGSLNHSMGQQTHYSHPDSNEDNLWFCHFFLVVPGKTLSNQAPSSLYAFVAL